MEGKRFDRVTRALLARMTRRRVIASMFGVAIVDGTTSAVAADRGRRCQRIGAQCTRHGQCCSGICRTAVIPGRRRRQVCGCPTGRQACGGACVDVSRDPLHCGGCGVACESGVCDAGTCTVGDSGCDPETMQCTVNEAEQYYLCAVAVGACDVTDGYCGNFMYGATFGVDLIPCTIDSECEALLPGYTHTLVMPSYRAMCASSVTNSRGYRSGGSGSCVWYGTVQLDC
jgi:hypothetical protein